MTLTIGERAALLVLLDRAQRGFNVDPDEVRPFLSEEDFGRWRALTARHIAQDKPRYIAALEGTTTKFPIRDYVETLTVHKRQYKSMSGRIKRLQEQLRSLVSRVKLKTFWQPPSQMLGRRTTRCLTSTSYSSTITARKMVGRRIVR